MPPKLNLLKRGRGRGSTASDSPAKPSAASDCEVVDLDEEMTKFEEFLDTPEAKEKIIAQLNVSEGLTKTNPIPKKTASGATEADKNAPSKKPSSKYASSYDLTYPNQVKITGLPGTFNMKELLQEITFTFKVEMSKAMPFDSRRVVILYFKDKKLRDSMIQLGKNFIFQGKMLIIEPWPADSTSETKVSLPVKSISPVDERLYRTMPFLDIPYELQLDMVKQDAENLSHRLHSLLCYRNKSLSGWAEDACKKNDGTIFKLDPVTHLDTTEGTRVWVRCPFGESKNQLAVGLELLNGEVYPLEPGDRFKDIADSIKRAAKRMTEFARASGKPSTHKRGKRIGVWNKVMLYGAPNDRVMLEIILSPESLSKVELAKAKADLKEFFLNGDGKDANICSLYLRFMKSAGNIKTSCQDELILIAGSPDFEISVLGLKYNITPNSLTRVHPTVLEILYASIAELADPTPDSVVMDLYAGSCGIAFSLAESCQKAYAIEHLEVNYLEAETNKALNNIKNVEIFKGRVEYLLQARFKNVPKAPIIVVIDPPRSGTDIKVIDMIRAQKNVKKVVYVVNKTRFDGSYSLDLMDFCASGGTGLPFLPVRVIPVDNIPHTPENMMVVLLERVDPSSFPKSTKPPPVPDLSREIVDRKSRPPLPARVKAELDERKSRKEGGRGRGRGLDSRPGIRRRSRSPFGRSPSPKRGRGRSPPEYSDYNDYYELTEDEDDILASTQLDELTVAKQRRQSGAERKRYLWLLEQGHPQLEARVLAKLSKVELMELTHSERLERVEELSQVLELSDYLAVGAGDNLSGVQGSPEPDEDEEAQEWCRLMLAGKGGRPPESEEDVLSPDDSDYEGDNLDYYFSDEEEEARKLCRLTAAEREAVLSTASEQLTRPNNSAPEGRGQASPQLRKRTNEAEDLESGAKRAKTENSAGALPQLTMRMDEAEERETAAARVRAAGSAPGSEGTAGATKAEIEGLSSGAAAREAETTSTSGGIIELPACIRPDKTDDADEVSSSEVRTRMSKAERKRYKWLLQYHSHEEARELAKLTIAERQFGIAEPSTAPGEIRDKDKLTIAERQFGISEPSTAPGEIRDKDMLTIAERQLRIAGPSTAPGEIRDKDGFLEPSPLERLMSWSQKKRYRWLLQHADSEREARQLSYLSVAEINAVIRAKRARLDGTQDVSALPVLEKQMSSSQRRRYKWLRHAEYSVEEAKELSKLKVAEIEAATGLKSARTDDLIPESSRFDDDVPASPLQEHRRGPAQKKRYRWLLQHNYSEEEARKLSLLTVAELKAQLPGITTSDDSVSGGGDVLASPLLEGLMSLGQKKRYNWLLRCNYSEEEAKDLSKLPTAEIETGLKRSDDSSRTSPLLEEPMSSGQKKRYKWLLQLNYSEKEASELSKLQVPEIKALLPGSAVIPATPGDSAPVEGRFVGDVPESQLLEGPMGTGQKKRYNWLLRYNYSEEEARVLSKLTFAQIRALPPGTTGTLATPVDAAPVSSRYVGDIAAPPLIEGRMGTGQKKRYNWLLRYNYSEEVARVLSKLTFAQIKALPRGTANIPARLDDLAPRRGRFEGDITEPPKRARSETSDPGKQPPEKRLKVGIHDMEGPGPMNFPVDSPGYMNQFGNPGMNTMNPSMGMMGSYGMMDPNMAVMGAYGGMPMMNYQPEPPSAPVVQPDVINAYERRIAELEEKERIRQYELRIAELEEQDRIAKLKKYEQRIAELEQLAGRGGDSDRAGGFSGREQESRYEQRIAELEKSLLANSNNSPRSNVRERPNDSWEGDRGRPDERNNSRDFGNSSRTPARNDGPSPRGPAARQDAEWVPSRAPKDQEPEWNRNEPGPRNSRGNEPDFRGPGNRGPREEPRPGGRNIPDSSRRPRNNEDSSPRGGFRPTDGPAARNFDRAVPMDTSRDFGSNAKNTPAERFSGPRDRSSGGAEEFRNFERGSPRNPPLPRGDAPKEPYVRNVVDASVPQRPERSIEEFARAWAERNSGNRPARPSGEARNFDRPSDGFSGESEQFRGGSRGGDNWQETGRPQRSFDGDMEGERNFGFGGSRRGEVEDTYRGGQRFGDSGAAPRRNFEDARGGTPDSRQFNRGGDRGDFDRPGRTSGGFSRRGEFDQGQGY